MTEHPSLINCAEKTSKPFAFLVLTVLINLYNNNNNNYNNNNLYLMRVTQSNGKDLP